ncbi:PDC sensor domain-containing protein, partial [Falsiroseomonas oryziterrae]|uniref:PDC sensor domain-containing protein n=1 Tax=Falsiroseomonas oryziterrae TaxID=2911368 RepID=UPI001F35E0E7
MPDTRIDTERLIAGQAPAAGRGQEVRSLGTAGRRLGLLLGAVLLLLAGSIAVVTWQDHRASLEESWGGVERAALGASGHAERSLAVAALVSERVADILRREGTATLRGAGHRQLATILQHARVVGSLWILNEAGDLEANSFDPDPPAVNFADRPYFAPLRAGAAFDLGPMLLGRVSGIWFFSYNRAVRDPDGRLSGVVQASLHGDQFERFHRTLGLGASGEIGLFRRSDGAPMMVHPLPSGSHAGIVAGMHGAPDDALLRRVAAGVLQGRDEVTRPDGVRLLRAWQVDEPDGQVIAVATLPRAEALAAFRARLARNAIAAALAASLVAGLGAAVASA